MKVKYDNPIRTNITKETKIKIENFCEVNGIKISDFLRDAVEFYLSEMREDDRAQLETIVIYNSSMAYYLRKLGFTQIKMEENNKQPGRHIYIFEKTKELQVAMANYSKSNSNSISISKGEVAEDGNYTTSTTIKSQR